MDPRRDIAPGTNGGPSNQGLTAYSVADSTAASTSLASTRVLAPPERSFVTDRLSHCGSVLGGYHSVARSSRLTRMPSGGRPLLEGRAHAIHVVHASL